MQIFSELLRRHRQISRNRKLSFDSLLLLFFQVSHSCFDEMIEFYKSDHSKADACKYKQYLIFDLEKRAVEDEDVDDPFNKK